MGRRLREPEEAEDFRSKNNQDSIREIYTRDLSDFHVFNTNFRLHTSSTMTSTKPTLAFFGPTGGCANATLALALKGGYKCSARSSPYRISQ